VGVLAQRIPDPRSTEDQEVDVQPIIDLLVERGLDEGQPQQVAGRWIENGFEDAAEIGRWLDEGCTDPEDARAQRDAGRPDALPGERHDDPDPNQRDVARGMTDSRSRPGDEPEQT
jgi:hypothetical protein